MSALIRRCLVRLHPYVDQTIAQQLAVHCAGTGATVSAVVEAALREHLERTGAITDILRCLDRLGRGIERAHRDLELFTAAFAVWVKIWFAYMPRIDGDEFDLVCRSAESRFSEFVEEVAHEYSRGHHVVEELRRATAPQRADAPSVAQGSVATRGTDASGRSRDT